MGGAFRPHVGSRLRNVNVVRLSTRAYRPLLGMGSAEPRKAPHPEQASGASASNDATTARLDHDLHAAVPGLTDAVCGGYGGALLTVPGFLDNGVRHALSHQRRAHG